MVNTDWQQQLSRSAEKRYFALPGDVTTWGSSASKRTTLLPTYIQDQTLDPSSSAFASTDWLEQWHNEGVQEVAFTLGKKISGTTS